MSIKILAIETSTKYCSVALSIDKKIESLFTYKKNKHAEYILPMVNRILLKNKIFLKEIDAIAYSSGPGNFTSMRIGVGIVQGLALGSNLKIIPISRMKTIAQKIYDSNREKNKIFVILHAFKKEFYFAKFEKKRYGIWSEESNKKLVNFNKIFNLIKELDDTWIIGGDFLESYIFDKTLQNVLLNNVKFTSAKDMIPIAIEKFKKKCIYNVEDIEIQYLHDKIIT